MKMGVSQIDDSEHNPSLSNRNSRITEMWTVHLE